MSEHIKRGDEIKMHSCDKLAYVCGEYFCKDDPGNTKGCHSSYVTLCSCCKRYDGDKKWVSLSWLKEQIEARIGESEPCNCLDWLLSLLEES